MDFSVAFPSKQGNLVPRSLQQTSSHIPSSPCMSPCKHSLWQWRKIILPQWHQSLLKWKERSSSSESPLAWRGQRTKDKKRRARETDRKNGCCKIKRPYHLTLDCFLRGIISAQQRTKWGSSCLRFCVCLLLLYFSRCLYNCLPPKQVSFLVRLLTVVAAYIFLVSCFHIYILFNRKIHQEI